MRKKRKFIFIFNSIIIILLLVILGVFLWKSGNPKQENGSGSTENTQLPQIEDTGVQDEALGEPDVEDFTDKEPEPEPQPEIKDVTMVFAGDVLLSEAVRRAYDSYGIDGILSSGLQEEMLQADFTMVNEEFPFSTRGTQAPDKQYTFRLNPSYVSAFHEMGVDVVTLANNHALDYGTDALLDTFTTLDQAGIPYVGAGETKERAKQPAFMEYGDRKVGVLAASRVIPVVSWNIENQQPGLFCTYDSGALEAAIKETKAQCDFVVVYVHWGIERQAYPEEYQRTLGQAYIDAGADLVIGAHPHVPQGIEYYKGKPIVYSLGNFIFGSSTVSTYMTKALWDKDGNLQLQVIPVGASNAHTSRLEGQEAEEVLRYIESISYDITIDENGMVSSLR